jgi:glycosyltransferase involved in cell wall biosynthesis
MLHAVTVIPPPVSGQTLATRAMLTHLAKTGQLRTYSLSHTGTRGWVWSVRKHLGVSLRIARALLSAQPRDSLYLVPDSGLGLIGLSMQSWWIARRRQQVWLHHHVMSYLATPSRRMSRILRRLGPDVHHIVLATTMAEELRRHYDVQADRIHILGNTPLIDPPNLCQRPNLQCVGYLGQVSTEKGINHFMATIRLLTDHGTRVRALIAGPIPSAAIAQKVAIFIAEDPTHRQSLGMVKGADKDGFFAKIDVLLFPSIYANEAQPLTIFEALASGCPVLATPRGCIPAQLPPSWIMTDANWSEAAAETITDWIKEPDLYVAACACAALQWAQAYAHDQATLNRLIPRMVGR